MTREFSNAQFRTLDQADVTGKRVLVRVDLNVPIEDGKVTDATRIERARRPSRDRRQRRQGHPALAFRPAEGHASREMSLKPVAAALAQVLERPVAFADDCIGPTAEKAVAAMKPGDVLLLENTRFHKDEENNDPAFAAAAGQARRHLRQRRLLRGASRPCLDRGPRAHVCRPTPGRSMQAELEALGKGAGRARAAGDARSSAAPRSRPSSTCWTTWSPRSTRW